MFVPIAYFLIASIPLTSVGISVIILGLTSIALANARPYISPEASELILRTGMENTSALLEELGLSNKAIYLPSSMRDGRAQALIPLSGNKHINQIRNKIPGRLIVRYGENPEDMAIAITTPGSVSFEKLQSKPEPTSEEIETTLNYILIGLLDLAHSVAVNVMSKTVDVEVNGSRLHYEDIWYYRCLGSPIASIVATVVCEALAKPISILDESQSRGKSKIHLEVIE